MSDVQYREEAASSLRKVIAKRMVQSKLENPHIYMTIEVEMERAMQYRKKLNEGRERTFSFNDIIVKACAVTLQNHPECNASYDDGKMLYFEEINIGIAVAVEGGLLVPTVRNCESKNLEQLQEESLILIEKARNMKLRPREGMGGTFTVSNLGMFGIEHFAAIVNPPQALILAVGAIKEVPVVKDGSIQAGYRMKMTVSCDHKAVDGATGARFLQDLKKVLEDPEENGVA